MDMDKEQQEFERKEAQETDKKPIRNWFSSLRVMHGAIEFVGRHPFATGLLGLLAVLGFILSATGYYVDRREARESGEQLSTMKGNVEEVIQSINSPCSSPPCWTLNDLMRVSTIGRSKDFLDSKLPPAEYVRNNQSIYSIEDCNVRIEYRNSGVSYFSSALSRTMATSNGETSKVSCPFAIPRIMHHTSYSASSDEDKYDSSEYPDFPSDNALVTVQDILSLTHDDIRLSVACIECGNFSDPYIEAYAFGSHAGDFMDFYFEVRYSGLPRYKDLGHLAWQLMRSSFDFIGPDPDENNFVQTTDYCGRNVLREINMLLAFEVERVGIGRGTRVWSGPKVLFCP